MNTELVTDDTVPVYAVSSAGIQKRKVTRAQYAAQWDVPAAQRRLYRILASARVGYATAYGAQKPRVAPRMSVGVVVA